jgi:chemotaxis protein histidine kinase CheA
MLEPYEALLNSLVHIMRNIIDHGVEEPDLRKCFGKSPAGQVCFITGRMTKDGAPFFSLMITDDGAGIDTDSLRKKLAKRLGDAVLAGKSDTDIMQHIFDDDVSTSQQVSELSGRGVGLSAVRAEVMKLGGTIRVDSEEAAGTRFTLELPVIMSVSKP